MFFAFLFYVKRALFKIFKKKELDHLFLYEINFSNDSFFHSFIDYRYRVVFFMDLTVGQLVWARRHKDDIYWPGKITIISNNTNDLWSSQLHYNYLVQFFVTNQSIWITDILPYQQYRDSMTNESFMHYGLHPTIKQDFLNAVNQADYAISNQMYINSNELTSMTTMTTQQQQKLVPIIEDNTDNDFLLTPGPMFTSNSGNYEHSEIRFLVHRKIIL